MTIVRVQGNARGTTSGSSISVTMPSVPTQGNVLIACVGASDYSGFPTVTGISQTGVSWSKVVNCSYNDGASDLENSEIWVGTVSSGASTSITVSLSRSAAEGGICDVCEYSGVTATVDKTATNYGSASQPDTGTTATTTQAAELWIGAATTYENTQSTATNGFTVLDGALMSGVPYPIGLSYLEKIVSATGTANSTLGNNSWYGWTGCIATFKATTITQYTLTISAGTGGTTTPSVGSYSYDQGTNVQVTANPSENYVFDHWVLDESNNTDNPINVTMNSNHNLQATFTSLPHLRYRIDNQTYNLRIGAAGTGHSGMGGIPKITKGGQVYDIHLVETNSPNASPVRIKTTTGIKAIECAEACQSCQSCYSCETCQTGCEVSCQIGCEISCQTGCEVSCQVGCEITCQTGCEVSCQVCNVCVVCQTGNTCPPMYYTCQECETCQPCYTCVTTCETGCEVSCQTTCELSCEDCQTTCETICNNCQECNACQTRETCPIMYYTCETCQQCYPCYSCQDACESACQTPCDTDCQDCQTPCETICNNCQLCVICQTGNTCPPMYYTCQQCEFCYGVYT